MNKNSKLDDKDVKIFFQGYAGDFYDIYTGNIKSEFAKFLDKIISRAARYFR
jgi:hypothetical protein